MAIFSYFVILIILIKEISDESHMLMEYESLN